MADENEEMENYDYNEDNEGTEDGVEDFETLKRQKEELEEEKRKMQESLKKANSEAQKRRKKLEEVEQLGDPEELKQLKEWYEQQKEEEENKKSEIEKVKEKIKEQYEKDLRSERERREKLQGTLEKHMVDNQISQSLSENKGDTKVLPRYIRDYVKPDLENNSVYVVDDDGDPRINAHGDYMSINDFVGELKQDETFQKYFEGVSQGGSGSKPAKEETRGRPKKPKSRSEMTVQEKIAYIRENGQENYNKLPS